jgi:hypothetical protein
VYDVCTGHSPADAHVPTANEHTHDGTNPDGHARPPDGHADSHRDGDADPAHFHARTADSHSSTGDRHRVRRGL